MVPGSRNGLYLWRLCSGAVLVSIPPPPPPNRDLRQGRMDCSTEIYLVRQSPQVAQRQIICYRLSAMESK